MLSNKNISQEYIEASVLDHVAEKMLLSCNCNLDTAINLGVSSLLFSTIKERIEYFINHKRNLAKEYLNEMKKIKLIANVNFAVAVN